MAKRRLEFDSPWKTILEQYIKEFMLFFWPEKHAVIDWDKGYKFLDKELQKIVHNAATGNRILDKLVEFYLKTGQKTGILFHIEIQGRKETLFEERVFIYRIKLRQRYSNPIATMVILLDKDPAWRPSHYREAFWGSYLEMGFPIIKLLDYQQEMSALKHSQNPFAHVILAQLAACHQKNKQETLITKIELTKRLYHLGWGKEDIFNLYHFIDWVLILPPHLEIEYYQAISTFEQEEFSVKYVTSAERIGLAKGMQQGMQQGVQQGIAIGLLGLLKSKFNNVPKHYALKIEKADVETLLKWNNRVLEKETLAAVLDD